MARPKLVTICEAARVVGRKPGTIAHWAEVGKFKMAGLDPTSRNGRRHLYNLADIVRTAKLLIQPQLMAPPPGYVTVIEAGGIMRMHSATVCKMFNRGEIKGQSVLPEKGKQRVFILRAAALEWAATNSNRKPMVVVEWATCERRVDSIHLFLERGDKDSPRPLISHDNAECLHARRELWEKNNRVWRGNCVARGRKVG